MFQLIVLAIVLVIPNGLSTSISEIKQSFEKFKVDHGIVYANAMEEAHRLTIFAQNLAKIKAHNARADNGQHSYKLGVNKFADLTSDEFKTNYLGLKSSGPRRAPLVHKHTRDTTLPASFDWRDKGAVTDVKDQGLCGSCWAFSAVAAIEGANFLKNGELVSLSEQNLVDCDMVDEGCYGGLMFDAFEYVISRKGIDTEEAYPYKGYDDKCAFDDSKIGARISSYVNITSGDEDALASAVVQQPISVGVDATYIQFYYSGIFDSSSPCLSGVHDLNHGVTVVGYGTEGSTDYWIIKNSWGKDFGENGYFRLEKGKNVCGVATQASYPII